MKRYLKLVEFDTGDEKDTYDDFGLMLGNKSTPLPSIKENYIDIPGGNGTLDCTEATGEVKYNDREGTYPFTILNKFADLPFKISKISNYIHGKKFKVFHWDDPNFYYVGRLSIDDYKIDNALGTFTLKAIYEPYKLKKYETVYEYDIDGTRSITCTNLRMRVIPLITLDSKMEIEFNGNSYVLDKGTHRVLNIYFDGGTYDLMITGKGHIKISYQEGSL